MQLNVVQVNIYKEKFIDNLIEFLRKIRPDVLTMQEVTKPISGKTTKLFLLLEKELELNGSFVPIAKADTKNYLGNAVYVRGKIISEKTIWLKEYSDRVLETENDWENAPRNALDLMVEISGKKLHVISTHLAWTKLPMDTPEKLRQAKLLAEHINKINSLDEPFLLCGDFNMPPGTGVVKTIDAVAHNITSSKIKNSLHPSHYAASRLPNGLLVDYIYTSKHFRIKEISAPLVDISDHLPVCALLDL